MEKSKWLERYKDPRWQKKRLEILERDNWICRDCGDDQSTLNVHHKWYEKNKDVWGYNDNCYITLCDDCHSFIHELIDSKLINIRKLIFEGGFDTQTLQIFIKHMEKRDQFTNKLIQSILEISINRETANNPSKECGW